MNRLANGVGTSAKLRVPVPETPFRTLLERAAPDHWLWHTIATDQHGSTADGLRAFFGYWNGPNATVPLWPSSSRAIL